MADSSAFQWWNAVPWGLVVAGWFLINNQSNARETRKEIRTSMDKLKVLVDEMEDAAFEHHTTSQDPIRCMKIRRGIARIGREFLMASDAVGATNGSSRLVRFRQSITLKNFDSDDYAALQPHDPVVLGIGEAADELRHFLERSYSRKFH